MYLNFDVNVMIFEKNSFSSTENYIVNDTFFYTSNEMHYLYIQWLSDFRNTRMFQDVDIKAPVMSGTI